MVDKENNHLRLVSWSELPGSRIDTVFPDVVRCGDMAVEFESTEMNIYRFKDAAGNDQFAFDRGNGAVSHGSHILSSVQISELRKAGASIGGC